MTFVAKRLFSLTPPPIPMIEVSAGENGGSTITITGANARLTCVETARLGRALILHAAGAAEAHDIPAIGTPMAGGFFGAVSRDGMWIIVAPKDEGETSLAWKTTTTASSGARSFVDGAANTSAIDDDDHPAAAWCSARRIGGFDDWHLGSADDMRDLSRTMMPRAGGNPEQTTAEAFREGGEQAFEQEWHWTSTEQRSGYAWAQGFGVGGQSSLTKGTTCRVRAVRKIHPFTP